MAQEEIRKLSDGDHIRLRTEMYLGSRSPHNQTVINWNGKSLEPQEMIWVPAVFTSFRELFDNALDEVVGHGHGSRIDITYDETTTTFSVKDDGRGIPIDWDENEHMHKATMVLVYPRTGRNFGERGEIRGTNGIGASATIHCSSKSSVTIYRDGKKFTQSFNEPNAVITQLQANDPKITNVVSDKTGTTVEVTLSPSVFNHLVLPTMFLKARVFEVATNHPNIRFYFNNEKIIVKPTVEKTLFADNPYIKIPVEQDKFSSTFYLVPNFVEEGEYVHSLVNDIPAFNGGHHIDVFKRQFFSNLIKSLERESKRRNLTPNRSDVSEGILVYNVTKMLAPTFDSQSKTRLINEEVESFVKSALDDERLYKKITKDHKEWIDQIYARCAARTQKKDDQETAKLARKVLRSKVPKLMDATGKDRSKCILLITEGDCLHEDTEIATFENGEFVHKKIKDIHVGDLVLTHTGSFKTVSNKQAKITDGLSFTTSSGKNVIISNDHKMVVFNTATNQYENVKGKDIDKAKHRLLVSIIDMDAKFFDILDVSDFDDKTFNKSMSFTDGNVHQSIITSDSHLFSVLDIKTGIISKTKASDLDIDNHLLISHKLN